MHDGKPHPRAKYAMVSEDIAFVWPYDGGCSIEIYGECVAVLFKGSSPPALRMRMYTSVLIVWNWETGEKLVVMLVQYQSFRC